jgi:alcohol dehydrogenase (cytochrome c)
MQDSGAILAFTYTGEGAGEDPSMVSKAKPAVKDTTAPIVTGGIAPQFTAAQAAAGKTEYNANCAVCHGSTLTNGTFGTPLGGQYFKANWGSRSVKSLFDRFQKTMPPAEPGTLPAESYANILTYILESNGFKPGNTPLPAGGEALDKMTIK